VLLVIEPRTVTVTLAQQASRAEGSSKVHTEPHSTVLLEAQARSI